MLINLSGLPTDKWLLACGARTGQEYMVHLSSPILVARVSASGDPAAEAAEDAYDLPDGRIVWGFRVLDGQGFPGPEGFEALMREAESALGLGA